MSLLRASVPVPDERAERYRAAGWWDGRRISDGIEAAAGERPDALAVIDNDGQLTYGELARRVQVGLGRLSDRGVGPGVGVVLIAGNTIPAVVAYHALLRSGATMVVLDRRCGAADVGYALDLVGPTSLVIAPAQRLDDLAGDLGAAAVAPLERFGGGGDAEPGIDWPEPDRDVPAVVLFTSGTTSRPKGVMHSVNTLTAGAENMATITGSDEQTVLFLISPLTSIAGIMQMHLAADNHATLVLEDRFDPEGSLDRLNATGATLLGGAPVIAEHLLRAAEGRGDGRLALRSLALGGAMLPLPVLELAADAYGIEVARVYGSSEAPNSTGSVPADGRATRLADDGALMPGTEVRVGSSEHPQEGLLRGPALFLGYADPADNEAAFEDGWFRTGDAVEVTDDRLTVVGRLKEIVNRNGLKISLAEVEGALARLPQVSEYACFGLPDEATGERLVVAVRPDAGSEPTLAGVIEHLRAQGVASRKLPEQLVVWREPLPRTASGKVVRSRLVRESADKVTMVAERLRS